jgi:hypothetical protein
MCAESLFERMRCLYDFPRPQTLFGGFASVYEVCVIFEIWGYRAKGALQLAVNGMVTIRRRGGRC